LGICWEIIPKHPDRINPDTPTQITAPANLSLLSDPAILPILLKETICLTLKAHHLVYIKRIILFV
jgi:hypothetical protein